MFSKKSIGRTLKQLRIQAGLSVNDVSRMIGSKFNFYLDPYTLLDYEEELFVPDTVCFLLLCTLYDCKDVLHEFGLTAEGSIRPGREDYEILRSFHKLSDSGKDMIRGALGITKWELMKKNEEESSIVKREGNIIYINFKKQ